MLVRMLVRMLMVLVLMLYSTPRRPHRSVNEHVSDPPRVSFLDG
jgi:hypothetical protein